MLKGLELFDSDLVTMLFTTQFSNFFALIWRLLVFFGLKNLVGGCLEKQTSIPISSILIPVIGLQRSSNRNKETQFVQTTQGKLPFLFFFWKRKVKQPCLSITCKYGVVLVRNLQFSFFCRCFTAVCALYQCIRYVFYNIILFFLWSLQNDWITLFLSIILLCLIIPTIKVHAFEGSLSVSACPFNLRGNYVCGRFSTQFLSHSSE